MVLAVFAKAMAGSLCGAKAGAEARREFYMYLNTVCYSDIQGLPVHEQMFAYAEAYRSAAATHCHHMTTDATSCTWPNGSVVLMLTAHAIELFLKGAILKRSPNAEVGNSHGIDDLSAAYKLQFPEPSFEWDILMRGGDGYPASFTPEQIKEIEALKKLIRDPSILYRYPVDKNRKEWPAILGFEPLEFLSKLERAKKDFERIRSQLANRS